MGPFFDFFGSDRFGSWGPWLESALQSLGIIFTIIMVIFLGCCILSKALIVRLHPLTTKQSL